MFDKTKQFVRDRWALFLAAWVGVSVWARVAIAAVGLSAVIAGGLYAASGSAAGFMSSAHFTKLSALQTQNNSWGDFKITSLGSGTDPGDAINYNELLNPFKVAWLTEDFFAGASTSATIQPFYGLVAGAGATVTTVTTGQDATHMGIWQCSTGTTATGRCAILTSSTANNIVVGTVGQMEWDWMVRLPALSTTGVQQYTYEVGLSDTAAATPAVNGSYFRYNATESTAWQFCTASGGSQTCTATSSTVTAGAWIRLGAIKAEGSLNWTGYVNGVTTGITNSTNVPSGAGAPLQTIAWQLSTVGTTAKTSLHDAVRWKVHFATERGP